MQTSTNPSAHINLVIWGMHRSGTSLLCTLLEKSGVYFGEPDQLVPPNDENPDGFWENIAIRKLNDSLLKSAGCDWDHIGKFTTTNIPVDLLTQFRNESRSIYAELDQRGISGIKDPRMCVLTEVWQPLLEQSVNIFVYRHPAEIAKSLLKRNGIPFEVGLCLCEHYLVQVINYLSSRDYLLVDHQDLLFRPFETIKNLSRYLLSTKGVSLPELSRTTIESVVKMNFYRAKLDQEKLPAPLESIQINLHMKKPPLHLLRISIQSKSILHQFEREESEKSFLLARDLQNDIRLQRSHLEKLESKLREAHIAITEKNTALDNKNMTIADQLSKLQFLSECIQISDQAIKNLASINQHLKKLTRGIGLIILVIVSYAARLLSISKFKNIDSKLKAYSTDMDRLIEQYTHQRSLIERHHEEKSEKIK